MQNQEAKFFDNEGVMLSGTCVPEATMLDENGNELTTVNINGTARGLAAAGQRLYISTDDGSIYAFGEAEKPIVNNSPATEITDTSANFNGEIVSTGAAATCVILYWDTTDHGTNLAAWSNQIYFGQRSPGFLSTNVVNLFPNTTYYYTYCATNAFGKTYDHNSVNFKTHGAPAINNGTGASGIGVFSAQLNANLTDGTEADVTFYWGTADGGTNSLNWQFSSVVSNVSEGAVSLAIPR